MFDAVWCCVWCLLLSFVELFYLFRIFVWCGVYLIWCAWFGCLRTCCAFGLLFIFGLFHLRFGGFWLSVGFVDAVYFVVWVCLFICVFVLGLVDVVGFVLLVCGCVGLLFWFVGCLDWCFGVLFCVLDCLFCGLLVLWVAVSVADFVGFTLLLLLYMLRVGVFCWVIGLFCFKFICFVLLVWRLWVSIFLFV